MPRTFTGALSNAVDQLRMADPDAVLHGPIIAAQPTGMAVVEHDEDIRGSWTLSMHTSQVFLSRATRGFVFMNPHLERLLSANQLPVNQSCADFDVFKPRLQGPAKHVHRLLLMPVFESDLFLERRFRIFAYEFDLVGTSTGNHQCKGLRLEEDLVGFHGSLLGFDWLQKILSQLPEPIWD